jgi:HlyD family secretion protein
MSEKPASAGSLVPAGPRWLRFWRSPALRSPAPRTPVLRSSAWTRQDFLPPQPELEDVLSEPPPNLLRGVHYVVAALLVSLLVIASIVKVDMIIAASGRLIADSPTIVVQPLQISIIREVLVKAGDTVHKGDVLARLDPTFTQADKATLQAQQDDLNARTARLEAEADDTPLSFAADSPNNALQLKLYDERQSQFAGSLQAFDEDIQRYKSAITASESNSVLLKQQLEIAKQVEAMRAKLYKLQSGSQLTYLDSQVVRMRTEKDFQDNGNHLVELKHFLAATQAQRQVFIDNWHRQVLEELTKAKTDASGLSESMTKAVRMNDLVILTAPEDGVVLDVAKRSVGSVLQEAEPLITLVPTGTSLIAEVMINSADVGYTKLGDEVAVKVDAFPYQRHGLLTGKLRAVGEDSVSAAMIGASNPQAPQQVGVFHRSQVTLNDTVLHDLPAGTKIIPGMTVTAEIKVGSRSVISYFLDPIRRGFSESIREP